MTVRYYITNVVGSGTEDDPYRSALVGLLPETGAVIPTGPDGHPTTTWCLAVGAGPDHAKAEADPRCDPLPDLDPATKLRDVDQTAKDDIAAVLEKRGVPVTALTNAVTFRDVLGKIGRQLESGFDAVHLDLPRGV